MKESEIQSTERSNATQKVGIVGIIGNVFLFAIKITIALISKSQAMLADSVNSGTDILSSLMTVIGGKISGTPSDQEHNYGHGKAEYIFSMLISVLTVYLSFKVLIDGIISLVNKNEFEFSIWLIIVAITTIAVKILLYIFAKKIRRKRR